MKWIKEKDRVFRDTASSREYGTVIKIEVSLDPIPRNFLIIAIDNQNGRIVDSVENIFFGESKWHLAEQWENKQGDRQ